MGKPTFTNSSKRLWSEEECRNMVNAALLYLASKQPNGTLILNTADMLKKVEKYTGGLEMALSDDDSTLLIRGAKKQ